MAVSDCTERTQYSDDLCNNYRTHTFWFSSLTDFSVAVRSGKSTWSKEILWHQMWETQTAPQDCSEVVPELLSIEHYTSELQNPITKIIMFAMFVITPCIPVSTAKMHHLPLSESCWEGSFSFRKPAPLWWSRTRTNHGLLRHPQVCERVRRKTSANLALRKTRCKNPHWEILTIFWAD